MITSKQAQAEKTKPSEKKGTEISIDSKLKASKRGDQVMAHFAEQEESVDLYVKQNNKEAAVKLLFDLIVGYAKEKNFAKAEALWKRLLEVDPMALSEINKSGEIVEEEKFKSIDQDHLDIWSGLYDTLTTEETNALYYAMKESTYDAGQHIFKQGERNSNLYFINQGQLEVFYSVGGEEILLQTLGSGSVVGEDAFFSNTVCTTSMVTRSRVKLNFLDIDSLMKWKDQLPALESKLHNHCLRSMKVYDLLERKSLDRRSQKRVNISGKAVIQLLNVSGNPVGRAFRARLSDISVGGLSFYIKIPKKEAARSLLGRNLNMKFILPTGGSEEKIDQNGTVVAVHSHAFDDYSVHIKFDAMLSEKVVEEVERLSNPIQ